MALLNYTAKGLLWWIYVYPKIKNLFLFLAKHARIIDLGTGFLCCTFKSKDYIGIFMVPHKNFSFPVNTLTELIKPLLEQDTRLKII